MALYFGSSIETAYVGDSKVKRIYKGDTLVFEDKPLIAFAVYSNTDKSLNFYKRETVPNVGDTFEGKSVDIVYTGIEEGNITTTNNISTYAPSRNSPFYEAVGAQSISVIDYIVCPKSIGSWFETFQITTVDLSKFDTSNVINMYNLFMSCRSLTSITGLENFDTSKVTNISYMFYDCIKLSGEITIMNSNIENYSNMFSYCSTKSGSKFTVNYKSGCQTVAQGMVNTKSSNSNVVLGTQV